MSVPDPSAASHTVPLGLAAMATLDATGKVVATNDLWDRLMVGLNVLTAPCGAGANIIEVCRNAPKPILREIAVELEQLRTGKIQRFDRVLPGTPPFLLWATRLESVFDSSVSVVFQQLGTAADLQSQPAAPAPPAAEPAPIPRSRESLKLEAMGVLAGGLAYEIHNWVATILKHTDGLLDSSSEGAPEWTALGLIETAAGRASELLGQIQSYAAGRFSVRPVDLSALATDVAHQMRIVVPDSIALAAEPAAGLAPVRADPSHLRQAMMSLITNAAEALGDGTGTITLRTGAFDAPDGKRVWFEVADDGPGMEAGTREKICDPFFTTKSKGRGLGLAAVQGIIEGYQGILGVTSRADEGTTVRIDFPAMRAAAKPAEQAGSPAPRCLLVIDDEQAVRELAQLMLQAFGFEVLVARDSLEGIQLLSERLADIGAILLDSTLPHLECAEAFAELKLVSAEVPILVTTELDTATAKAQLAITGAAGYITKPFELDTLVARTRAAVDG